MKPLSIGDDVRNGVYKVHSRFGRVLNLSDGNRLVSIVDPEIGAGPVNVVLDDRDRGTIDTLLVATGFLLLNDRRYEIDPTLLYDSSIEDLECNGPILKASLRFLSRLLVEESPAKSLAFLLDSRKLRCFRPGFETILANRIAEGANRLLAGDAVYGAAMLKGCGFGLTPSGDDFVAGVLVAMNLLRVNGIDLGSTIEKVYSASRSENMLSGTFLRLAKEGRVTERTRALIAGLLSGDDEDVVRNGRELLLVGETSGADFAVGMLMTLENQHMFAADDANRIELLPAEVGSGEKA